MLVELYLIVPPAGSPSEATLVAAELGADLDRYIPCDGCAIHHLGFARPETPPGLLAWCSAVDPDAVAAFPRVRPGLGYYSSPGLLAPDPVTPEIRP